MNEVTKLKTTIVDTVTIPYATNRNESRVEVKHTKKHAMNTDDISDIANNS
jgi:hypothetical protein